MQQMNILGLLWLGVIIDLALNAATDPPSGLSVQVWRQFPRRTSAGAINETELA
jgi:hypothetical protein